jgi:hypothetical protein
MAGVPKTFGPCVCESTRLVSIAPANSFSREIAGGAFAAGRFYWTDSGYINQDPYTSRIFAGPIGSSGTLLVDRIRSAVDWLRVTEDTIYAMSVDGPLAFSLEGQPLPNPTREEAFPTPAAGRVTLDNYVLSIDGAMVAEGISDYAETDEGVYYVGYADVLYRPFADLTVVHRIAKTDEPTRLWVSGHDLYVGSLPNSSRGERAVLEYGDLSIIGSE